MEGYNQNTFKKNINILIASEFVVFRKGLKLLIEKEENFSIIGEATDNNSIFKLANQTNPDIIIINSKLPSVSINSLCKNLHEKYPNLPILLFLENLVEISVASTIINGVRGIIWKENSHDDLIKAINIVSTGGLYFEDPEDCRLNCLLAHQFQEKEKPKEAVNMLSPREKEVLKLIAEGLSYVKIANKLMISNRTVESHKNNILVKLNLRNKNDLVRYAIINGI